MTTMELDAALATTYEDFNVPADQFFGNQDLIEAFTTAVRGRAGDPGLDSQDIMHRLLYLRKKGRLPRLRRSYYGRAFSDN